MELDGKVAIVTGAAVRIGKALALALTEQGVRVVVHYGSNAAAAEETVAHIKASGGEALAVQADLNLASQSSLVIERAIGHYGQIDILVNSAAIFEPEMLGEATESLWDREFAINLKSPFFLSQAFATHVGAERKGHIVNIADWRGAHPGAAYIIYTLTKAGLITMTKSLALALAPHIQVNAIAPGAILPPPGRDQAYLSHLAESIPARRTGSPDEVSRALIFLLRSDFITGEILFVTGGQHL